MKKLRWQVLVMILALAAITVLLLSQEQTLLSEEEAVVQPVSGGTYIEAVVGQPSRLNPLLDYANPVDYDIDRLIYCSLVAFDYRGLPYGDLAETWGISQDEKVYNFSIRPNALWHDGQPVTSEDVLFTIGLMRDENFPASGDLKEFWSQANVEALDDRTLRFELPEPFSPFMDYLNFGILPKHLLESLPPSEIVNNTFNIQPVGCGPFVWGGYEVEGEEIHSLTLDAFRDYYNQRPFIDQVKLRFFPDSGSAMAAYKQGEVNGISQITPELLPQALKNENLNVFTGRMPRLNLLYLNLDSAELPFFKETEIRRALLMGLNRRWILDRLLSGQGILANGPIFPESWAFYDGIEQIEYDPGRAEEMLKQAGYTFPAEGGKARAKDGIPLSFELVHPDSELMTSIAQKVQQDWGRLGVEVTLKALPYSELLSEYLEPRTYEAALVELDFSRSPDPDPYPFWHQAQITSGQNYAQWDDRQVSEYLEQARVMVDLDERIRRYRNFQVRFATEIPALTLFYPVYSYAVDKSVFGVSMGPLFDPSDRFANIAAWYMKTGPAAQALITPQP